MPRPPVSETDYLPLNVARSASMRAARFTPVSLDRHTYLGNTASRVFLFAGKSTVSNINADMPSIAASVG